jgi:serine/threonine-protein kinase
MKLRRAAIRTVLLAALGLALTVATPNVAQADTPQTVVDVATLKCLDSNAVGFAYTLSCNGGNYQNWHRHAGTFATKVINNQTGRCLDSNAAKQVYTLPCNGGSYQEWVFTYYSPYGYELRNVATGYCLDSNTSGNLYTHVCNGGNFQRWRIP